MEILRKYRLIIIIGILLIALCSILIFLNFTQDSIPERSIFVVNC